MASEVRHSWVAVMDVLFFSSLFLTVALLLFFFFNRLCMLLTQLQRYYRNSCFAPCCSLSSGATICTQAGTEDYQHMMWRKLLILCTVQTENDGLRRHQTGILRAWPSSADPEDHADIFRSAIGSILVQMCASAPDTHRVHVSHDALGKRGGLQKRKKQAAAAEAAATAGYVRTYSVLHVARLENHQTWVAKRDLVACKKIGLSSNFSFIFVAFFHPGSPLAVFPTIASRDCPSGLSQFSFIAPFRHP